MPGSNEIASECSPCLQAEAQTALEHLLRRENVTCDPSLATIMRQDWSIPAEALITHVSLFHLQLSVEDLLQAAAASSTLTANFEAQTVTPELRAKRTTIIIRDLPEDVGEDELRELLMQFTNTYVTGVQDGDSSPASTTDSPASNSVMDSPSVNVKSSKIAHEGPQIVAIRHDFGNSWFLTLTDEDVTTSVAMWLRSQRFRGGELLKVRVKSSIDLNASVCNFGLRQNPQSAPRRNYMPSHDGNVVHSQVPNDLSYGHCEQQESYSVDGDQNACMVGAEAGGAYTDTSPASRYHHDYPERSSLVEHGEHDSSRGAAAPHYVDTSGASIVRESSGCAQCDMAPCCDASTLYPCSDGYVAPANGAEYAYPRCGDRNCCEAGCTGWEGEVQNDDQVNYNSVMPMGGYQQGVTVSTCVSDGCGNLHTGEDGVLQGGVPPPCCMDAYQQHNAAMVNHPIVNCNMDTQSAVAGKSGSPFRGGRGRRRGYGEWQGGRRQPPDAYKQQHMVDGTGAAVEENNGAVYREYRRSDGNERGSRQQDGNKTNRYENRGYKANRGDDKTLDHDFNNNRGRSANRKARGDWQQQRDQPNNNNNNNNTSHKEYRPKKVVTPMTPQDFPSLIEAATLCKSSSFGKRSTTTTSFESVNERSRDIGGSSRS
eukprot:Lankesteria_metandrocarpae@DN8361_c0_g1_i1.p1